MDAREFFRHLQIRGVVDYCKDSGECGNAPLHDWDTPEGGLSLSSFFSVVTVDALEGPYFRTIMFDRVDCAGNDVGPLVALRTVNWRNVVG
jgi:hypothetical protein